MTGSMCMSVMSGYILINYWSVTSTHKSTWSGRLESKSSISTLTPLPPLSSHTDAHKCQLGKLGQVGAEKNQIRDDSFSGKFRVVSPPFSSLLPFSLSSSTSYSDAATLWARLLAGGQGAELSRSFEMFVIFHASAWFQSA